ncbi:hypothetical protein ACO1PF_00445 [Alkalibacterium sp. f15]|uniref:hypothetical protein n=1 Tax=Alkalibacterium sp. f15 TaxID=3414029 RepID=UPI003BF80A04
MIDYNKECSVLFFFLDKQGQLLKFNYQRPQHVDDNTLNIEAEYNAQDMIKKELHGAKELIAIGIARSEKQHDEMLEEIHKG